MPGNCMVFEEGRNEMQNTQMWVLPPQLFSFWDTVSSRLTSALLHSPHFFLYFFFLPCSTYSPIFFFSSFFFSLSISPFSPPFSWFSLCFFIHSSLSLLIYLFRANFQIYKPITAKRLCWGSLWACRCGGSWIPITELIWKKTLSVMWKWFGLRVKFIIITLISSQASALAAAKENTKA